MIGARLFDGDLDRAEIFSLFFTTGIAGAGREGAVSINSAALALGRPFETVRRHVNALIARGWCERTADGVRVAPAVWRTKGTQRAMDLLHDGLVRFLADATAAGILRVPPLPAGRTFERIDGVRAAIELTLAMVGRHRGALPDLNDFAVFSAVLATNMRRLEAYPQPKGPPPPGTRPFHPVHALRVASIARYFGMAETIVRRRAMAMVGPGKPLIRVRSGLLISVEWIASLDLVARGDRRHGTMTLILGRIAAAGFPFHVPALAYRIGRPPFEM